MLNKIPACCRGNKQNVKLKSEIRQIKSRIRKTASMREKETAIPADGPERNLNRGRARKHWYTE